MLTLEKLATHRMDVWGHSFPGCRGTQTLVLPRYAIRPGRRGPSWALAACRSSSTCWGGSYWSGAAGRAEQSLEGGTRSQAEDRVPIHSYCRLEVSPQVDNESVEVNSYFSPCSSHMVMFCSGIHRHPLLP